jgi:hypothetical protein
VNVMEMTREQATQAALKKISEVLGRLSWGKPCAYAAAEVHELVSYIDTLDAHTDNNQRSLRGVRIRDE